MNSEQNDPLMGGGSSYLATAPTPEIFLPMIRRGEVDFVLTELESILNTLISLQYQLQMPLKSTWTLADLEHALELVKERQHEILGHDR